MTRYASLIVATSLISMATATTIMADAKKLTVTQRQQILSSRINKAQISGGLTLKEANSLRDDLADITEDERDMKMKNGGKLSYADLTKIEKDLNGISNKIHKKQLAKRID